MGRDALGQREAVALQPHTGSLDSEVALRQLIPTVTLSSDPSILDQELGTCPHPEGRAFTCFPASQSHCRLLLPREREVVFSGHGVTSECSDTSIAGNTEL